MSKATYYKYVRKLAEACGTIQRICNGLNEAPSCPFEEDIDARIQACDQIIETTCEAKRILVYFKNRTRKSAEEFHSAGKY